MKEGRYPMQGDSALSLLIAPEWSRTSYRRLQVARPPGGRGQVGPFSFRLEYRPRPGTRAIL